MSRNTSLAVLATAASVLIPASAGFGAVSLTFSDKDATPTSTSVAPGGSFAGDVFLTLTGPADAVSGIDYRVQISGPGSGFFRILSRTSTAVFVPAFPDSDSRVAPVTLSPTNGTADLGGDRNGAANVAAAGSYEVADYVLQALSTTPAGTYTLSFVTASTTYTASGPNYATNNFAALGTFTVVVPEPATLGVAGLLVVSALRRRVTVR